MDFPRWMYSASEAKLFHNADEFAPMDPSVWFESPGEAKEAEQRANDAQPVPIPAPVPVPVPEKPKPDVPRETIQETVVKKPQSSTKKDK